MRRLAPVRARRPAAALGFEDALADIARVAPVPGVERVPLAALAGRRLARPVTARAPLPAFDNSAMDGYAVRAADTPGVLPVAGEAAAGAPGVGRVSPGTAWRISTGAPLPPGADAVVRQEDAVREGERIVVAGPVAPGHDVRRAGEDLAAGSVALDAGTVVRPHEVAVVAAAGHACAWCHRRLRVVLVVSGDELASPGAPLGAGQVYDCNLAGLSAQIAAAGAHLLGTAAVPDDAAITVATVRRLLDGHATGGEPPDVLITAGGVSVGPHDHLREALLAVGAHAVVPRVRVQPGQPTWVGTRGSQVVLALPGNPVSAAVCFHALGLPLLGQVEGWGERMPLAAPVSVRPGLAQLLRCRLGARGLEPLPRQGSGMVSSLAGADALAWIPEEAGELGAGAVVRMARLG